MSARGLGLAERAARRVRAGGLALGLALLALGAGGCKNEPTPIATLLANAGAHDGQSVTVVGEVKGAAGAFGYGVYQLDDGTGTITIITDKGGVPVKGAKVGVTGTFRSAFTVGTETVAAIQEQERHER